MRLTIAAACVTTFAIGTVILVATPGFDRLPPGGRAVPYLGIALAWGFVAVGSFAWLRRPDNRTGALMTIVGVGVALTGFSLFDVPVLWAIGATADTVIISLLIHLLLAFPSGRLETRGARIVAALGYVAGVLQPVLVLFSTCGSDLGDDCPSNPILISDDRSIASVIETVQGVFAVVAVTLTVVLLLRRWRASNHAQRRGLEPVLLLGAVIMVLGLATAATQSAGAGEMAAQIAFIAAFALLPAAFLLGLVRTRFFRTATVGRLIEQLARDRDLRDALADALGDPTLEVAYWLPERGYVDRAGHPIEAGERELTEIDHEGRRVGALLHARVLSETPELVVEASAAAVLALENARLEVELRAQVEALRASRARLVEAGDAERRRLGRDLHDGAQQRLVALMIELQLARERLPADADGALELVESAFANAQAAVGELRDLASGIHPAVLSQRGLDAALESLASRAPVPVELDSALAERLPSAVETAAYFVVAEALTNVAKYAGATYARVEVRRENGCAVVDVRDDGVGGANAAGGSGLRGLGDRVGALDGTLEVESPRGAGTLIRARIPLG
ncbi:histidine kinase [Solirubrobacter ginsenosidimutans]|uniref:histidine kinase n=1 Tax=Solirubrobacter ginsenosidimutans TaxID=490573 RepID=A0A9X3MXI4_9ACTN|nr:histidine kinase [Solirubrobacter ginsenosidimutans]MDA0164539.1 histidine kinase [Solirubrobacter ginsenosidimutans]